MVVLFLVDFLPCIFQNFSWIYLFIHCLFNFLKPVFFLPGISFYILYCGFNSFSYFCETMKKNLKMSWMFPAPFNSVCVKSLCIYLLFEDFLGNVMTFGLTANCQDWNYCQACFFFFFFFFLAKHAELAHWWIEST